MAAVGSTGIFASNATSYVWLADANTALSSTITLPKITYPRQPNVEVGLWSLLIKATSAISVVVIPSIYFLFDEYELLYSTVKHPLTGYSTASPSTKVANFDPLNGACFEANLGSWQTFWLYADGFKVEIQRASNIAITFNYGGVKMI